MTSTKNTHMNGWYSKDISGPQVTVHEEIDRDSLLFFSEDLHLTILFVHDTLS